VGFRSNARAFFSETRAGFTGGGLAFPSDDLISALTGGNPTTAGEKIDTTTAMRIADVFTAVNIIAELVGSLPLKVFRQVGDDTVCADTHRAYRMLHDAPNPSMPAFRFWSTLTTHLLLWGNAYIQKMRDENGLVNEIWLLHPSWVTVEWSWERREKRFIVYWPYGDATTLDESAVLHIFGVSTDGLIGLSPIAQCREALGVSSARTRFEADMYNRKPFVTGVIEHPGQIRDAAKLREGWSAIYGSGATMASGTQNHRHGVASLEEGAHFNQLTMPLADMQFVESADLSKTQIATIFKMPPWYLGGSAGHSLTYQTVEGNDLQLAKHCIAPVTTCIAKFLSADSGIFPFPSWYPEFVLDALMRADSAARVAYYTGMAGINAMTVDEIREKENLPPMPVEEQDEVEEAAMLGTADPAAGLTAGSAPAPGVSPPPGVPSPVAVVTTP